MTSFFDTRCARFMIYPLGAALAALAALLMLALPASAAPEATFESAFELFQEVSRPGGDRSGAQLAADQFAALSKADPANPLLLAYAGSSTTMLATTTLLPWKKMSYADDGLAQLDKALAMLQPAHDAPRGHHAPASLETRFVAASTFIAVPDFMNRQARGEKLLAEVQASPLFATSPPGFRGSVWMTAARHAQKLGHGDEAKQLYAEVIAQHAPQAPAAEAQLKELAQ